MEVQSTVVLLSDKAFYQCCKLTFVRSVYTNCLSIILQHHIDWMSRKQVTYKASCSSWVVDWSLKSTESRNEEEAVGVCNRVCQLARLARVLEAFWNEKPGQARDLRLNALAWSNLITYKAGLAIVGWGLIIFFTEIRTWQMDSLAGWSLKMVIRSHRS